MQQCEVLHAMFPGGFSELDPGTDPHPRPLLWLWEASTQPWERVFRFFPPKRQVWGISALRKAIKAQPSRYYMVNID